MYQRELEQASFATELQREIDDLSNVLHNDEFIMQINSTRQFWFDNKDRFLKLNTLARALSNISASSAFIERYFSICGVSARKFSSALNDLFEMRTMLKVNIDTLNELK